MASSLGSKIRELLAAAAAIAVVATSTALVGPEPLDVEQVRVGAFNIQVFGQAKLAKPEVMSALVEIAQHFDVLVVQEVRDRTEQTADEFLALINAESERSYEMYEGPRLGSTNSKEQYVLYFVPSRVELIFADVLADPERLFERPPLVAFLQAGNFDFTLVAIHVRPDDAAAELEALATVARLILEENPDERDVILLGDFNADGRYFDEQQLPVVFPPELFQVVITDDMITTTKTENTYDRIILTDGTIGHEYIADSAQPFVFDLVLSIDDLEFVAAVSDHYPVIAEFSIVLEDDD